MKFQKPEALKMEPMEEGMEGEANPRKGSALRLSVQGLGFRETTRETSITLTFLHDSFGTPSDGIITHPNIEYSHCGIS